MSIPLNKLPWSRLESASKASNVRISEESGRNQRKILLTSIWLKEEDLKQSHLNNLKRHCWKMIEFSLPMCWPYWCLVTILYILTSSLYIINFKYLSDSNQFDFCLYAPYWIKVSVHMKSTAHIYDNSGLISHQLELV